MENVKAGRIAFTPFPRSSKTYKQTRGLPKRKGRRSPPQCIASGGRLPVRPLQCRRIRRVNHGDTSRKRYHTEGPTWMNYIRNIHRMTYILMIQPLHACRPQIGVQLTIQKIRPHTSKDAIQERRQLIHRNSPTCSDVISTERLTSHVASLARASLLSYRLLVLEVVSNDDLFPFQRWQCASSECMQSCAQLYTVVTWSATTLHAVYIWTSFNLSHQLEPRTEATFESIPDELRPNCAAGSRVFWPKFERKDKRVYSVLQWPCMRVLR